MQSVVGISPTGNQDIDGVLGDVKWGSNALTFSFPALASSYAYDGEASTGFSAFSAQQADAVRAMFAKIASLTDLSFTEATGSAAADADLRFAQTNLTSTAWVYGPGTDEYSGDAWFNASRQYFASPQPGTYGFLVMLHEIGHLLGLEHGHSAYGFGALPADHNSMEYSVMTYASYVGASTKASFTNGVTSYATTLMMNDIAALQALYGADFETNAGDTVYRWNPVTGEFSVDGAGQGRPAGNKVFMTIWDGGGTDTYDLSNYKTALTINLNPGAFSTLSTVQLADLSGDGTHKARGNVANALLFEGDARSLIENAIGGTSNDRITGNAANNALDGRAGRDTLDGGDGDDTLTGGAGADTLIGGAGFDTVSYEGAARAVSLSLVAAGRAGDASGDTFSGIEAVIGSRFNDTITGSAASDEITGGLGRDILTGGLGSDIFHFRSSADGGDTIKDFAAGQDALRFEASGFGGALAAGLLEASQFVLGKAAIGSGGQFVFDALTSKLWWDTDGQGAVAATHIATLTGVTALAVSDLVVI